MRIRHMIGWTFAGLFVCAGLLLRFALYGYRFTAYLCFAIAAVLAVYQLLGWMAGHNKKAAKLIRLILSTGIGLVLLTAMATGIYVGQAAASKAAPGCDYVIVLGAGVNGTQPSVILRERLEATLTYLQENPETVCVVSGGQGAGEEITEAQCMFEYLTARGIAEERVWMEEKATTTVENLTYSLELIRSQGEKEPEQIGLVSSEFHLFRASRMAKDLGIEAELIPAKTRIGTLRMNYYLREIPAVWYYLVFGG
ncbi:MAG: YdcF family protein [Ruminococcaceae bacterium]|nr:YdcF family protein [Oscillospiraceae bacterium]